MKTTILKSESLKSIFILTLGLFILTSTISYAQDTDGDGIADSVDIDDDNDGILDTIEELVCGSSASLPFTSLGQARNVTSAGVYFFDLNGDTFSTYVDANGYVQVAIDFGNGAGNLPQGTVLTNSTRGILTTAALAELTDANEARISHSEGNFDVTTTNATILSRIRSNTTLHKGIADNGINNDWTGTEATAITVDASGTTAAGNSLHQNIVHVNGNSAGFHWIPTGGGAQAIRYAGAFAGEIADNESFTLWVRANTVAIVCSDNDGDGILNSLDLDADGDGITDNREAQTTAGYTAPTGVDTDGDGLDNAYDATPTTGAAGSNGITPTNTDSDSNSDYLDIDADDDGIPDNVEAQTTLGYTTPTGTVGNNGIDSSYENEDTYSPTTISLINTDNDAEPDFRDTDADGDGTTDLNENGEGNILSGSDLDGDGLDNNFDQDNVTYDVNDNINTPSTDLPDSDSDVNTTNGDVDYRDSIVGFDTDGDGIGDAIDIDDDNDGILDIIECSLNAVTNGNFDSGSTGWTSSGGWTFVNFAANETDSATGQTLTQTIQNFDSPSDIVDLTFLITAGEGNNNMGFTAQLDVSFNGTRYAVITNPVTSGPATIVYENGASGNLSSFSIDVQTSLTISIPEPQVASADLVFSHTADLDDWYLDDIYIQRFIDTDADGIFDCLDLDSDNDGITDNLEAQTTASFTAPTGTDTDGDGLDDAYDATPTTGATGSNGITPTNSDTDAFVDYLDIDTDDDGIPDNVEAQSTLGYTAPNASTGDNGIDTAYDFTGLYSSTGLNSTLINTDGDAEPDFRDIDSDGDTTNDIAENGDTDNVVSGTDTDGDGLDDNFEGASTNDADINDEINTPSSDLPDGDSDVNSGGDVDYRDNLVGTDTDGDGIPNSVDIDDDNDGILDTVEDGNDGTSASTPFTSLGQARNGTSAGVYFFDLSGDTFSTYVNAFGYVQIAIDFGNGVGNLPQGTSLTNSSRGILTPSVLAKLTDANEARISHPFSYIDVTSTNATILSRITSNTTLHQGQADNVINEDWIGIEAGAITTDAVGTSTTGNSLHQTIINIVGNPSGMIWIPETSNQRVRNTSGFFAGEIADAESFTLSVRSNTFLSNDFDGDGIVNSLDQDADGDGILDITESQASTGAIALSGVDTDGDGLDDAFDATPTTGAAGSNGITPVITVDDGNPDYLDIDTDEDGIPDNIEAQTTQGYTVPSGTVGLNGVDTAYENNDTFTATALTPNNFDTSDEPDYRNTDTDNDTIIDVAEGFGYANLNAGTLGTDSDGDGLDDIYEGADTTASEPYDANDEIDDPVNFLLDEDNDGATTGDVDYRDLQSSPDTDGDGIPDNVDIDDDNDGILDTIEDAIPDLVIDTDGIANSRDIDSDGDGIPDNVEAQSTDGYIAPSGIGTGITDIDMDGLDDNYDANTSGVSGSNGLTPVNTDDITGNNADSSADYLDTDSDGDGINDILENGGANTESGVDTDGDGLDDAFEGVLNDSDVNDDINTPATDLPDLDSDVNTTDSTQPDAPGYNDVDYRDIDDDRILDVTGKILWVRSDKDAAGTTTLTGWTDQTNTGITNTITGDPTINQYINFNPTVTFDGSGDYITTNLSINASTYPDLSVFTVYTPANDTSGAVWGEDDGSWDRFLLDNGGGLNDLISSGTGGITNVPNIFSAGSTVVTTITFDEDAANGSFAYANGLQSLNFTSNHGPESSNLLQIGALGVNDYNFNGSISEVIVYNSVLTSIHRQSVESYLAIKSGITLDVTNNDGTIVEGDYLLDDQTTKIWDYTANSTYHNDVAGIVRDDDMLLNQKQSTSINSDATITIGLGAIATNNAGNSNSINTNKSALIWGNNNVSLTAITSSTLLCETENQMDRIWKIVETGTIGTVEVAAVKATIDAALNETSPIILKIADDASFTTNVKHIPVTTRDVNGVSSYVADVDFTGTKYFTYSDVLGIFWNGDTNTWIGGAGTSNAPAVDAIGAGVDGTKVLVIDSGAAQRSAIMTASANVECVWVKPNSKLVINNDLFLEFDQDFILEGEIRLIGDAQLVQSHTGVSNVQGNGVIYRDQATMVPNTYRYNYWSSPVTTALGNTTYTVESVMKDGTTPTSENSSIKEINFVAYTGALNTMNGSTTDPITIASYWIFSYFNGFTRDDWVQKINTGVINIGEGFIMKSTGRAPQNFTFMGSPNDGTITKVLIPGTSSLLGNPYPSVIDTQQFISDNSNIIDGTLYFWEHQGESTTTNVQTEGHGEYGYIGGYSQRNSAMGVAANSVVNETAGLGQGTYTSPPQYIAVGQGFFVSTPTNKGGTLRFQNSQRAANTNNVFFRNSSDAGEELPNFKLGMDYVSDTNAEIHRQLGINFKEGNSFGYESGYDSQTFDMQPTDMFWDFDQIESNLVIAGVNAISADLQVPLGFNIDSEYPVKVILDETENMEGYTVYLGDLITGRLYNLENPIELNLPKGNYSNRFVIMFGGTALSTGDEPLLQDFNVYRNNDSQEIIIRNNNNTEIKKVELFNILGQAIKTWKSFDASPEHRLQISAPSAIYIVKVSTDKGEITKKVVFD